MKNKFKETIVFLRSNLGKTDKVIFIFIGLILIIAGVLFFIQDKPMSRSEEKASDIAVEEFDTERFLNGIREAEANRPVRLGDTPTEEEIYDSPYIKHIRVALNGYLEGTMTGVEDDPWYATSKNMKCGLSNFDQTYYQSKFVILDAYDNDYGGVQAYVVFIDKPDTVFWLWIYKYGGDSEEYVLRALCEKAPLEEDREIFNAYIDDAIKNSKYQL